ncbi:MAG: HEAT repeat domain-containing protein [Myxococcales bacterium]
MEGFVWFLILVVGAAFGIPMAIRHFKDRSDNFGAASSGAFGTDDVAQRAWEGEIEGFELRLEIFEKGSGENRRTGSRLMLDGKGRVPPDIALGVESSWQGLRKALGKNDVQVGDAEFDAAVKIRGPEDVVLATLGVEARALVRDFVASGGVVESGNLVFHYEGAGIGGAPLQKEARLLAKVAKSMVVDSVPVALLRNVRTDPNSQVRLRNLAALLASHAAAPETGQALEAALSDRDPEVRLLAAQRADASAAVQRTLEALVDDREAAVAVRAAALERLSQLFPYDAIAPLVRRALYQELEPLRRVAVEAAGRGRDASQLASLHNLVATRDEALGRSLAKALAAIGGSEAESSLIALLQSGSDAVKREAAVGLAQAGTVRSVEPLLPLSQGVLGNAALKEAARDAIRAIQSRLGDADGGRLSMVDERAGEGGLSVGAVANQKEQERG